ncbi:unnamed protein product [Triticum turgidum subsp. durum]|uniref:Histidine-containing phosphotransfer protein n=1 Tax=Triticum turgidum subsp. durum TaxID=4567 RepID=A0A9R0W2A4_TRITD|nr:unnamed protein product [Triticum turgidum subsp. durum]
MAAAALRAQLNAHIAGMYTEGVVDEDICSRSCGRRAPPPRSPASSSMTPDIIDDIDTLMEEPEVDFDEVEALTQQLMWCTSSVGAQQVNLACMHFGNFNAIKYKEGCLVSLALVRNEFFIVRHELEVMIELEEQIATCGPNS